MRQSYLAGPFGLLESREDGNTSYPLSDAHGDITATVDQAGAVTSRQSYDAFGTQLTGEPQTYGYLGAFQRRSDPDTGLIGMGARQYDPTLGRFFSEDRVLGHPYLGQSLNRYSYVFNRPLVLYDLDGEFPISLPITTGGPLPLEGRSVQWKDVKAFGQGCIGLLITGRGLQEVSKHMLGRALVRVSAGLGKAGPLAALGVCVGGGTLGTTAMQRIQ